MKFALGTVLSVTTGRLVSENGIGEVYEILNFMTGVGLYAHQLPRAAGVCGPVLLEQHPGLKNVNRKFPAKAWRKWLAKQKELHGEWLTVEPLAQGVYTAEDPVTELSKMRTPQ